MKKIVAVILTVMLISTLAVGCGKKAESPAPKPEPTVSDTEKKQDTPTGQTENPGEKADEKKDDVIEATGTYTGQVDNNFIEIKLDGSNGALEFNITEISDSFKGFKSGTKVKITYIVNKDNQNLLKSIEKLK